MASLSMSDVWDETIAFFRREKSLLLPLGFATFGLSLLIVSLAAPQNTAGATPPGPWMIWFLPGALLALVGSLAISAVALYPSISVREALGIAVARLSAAVSITLLIVAVMLVVLTIAATLMVAVGAGLGWTMQQTAVAALVLVLIPLFWLSLRLLPLWPLLTERRVGPLAAIRESLALTAGHAAAIAGILLLAAAAYLLVTGVAQLAGGSVFLLIGRMLGSDRLGHTLTVILVSAVGAVLATLWNLFVAVLYRRLAR